MKVHEAITILEHHNEWRRDNNNKEKSTEPYILGKAIDTVVEHYKNLELWD